MDAYQDQDEERMARLAVEINDLWEQLVNAVEQWIVDLAESDWFASVCEVFCVEDEVE